MLDLETLRTTPRERDLIARLERLSLGAGSHSPSLATMQETLPDIDVQIDACYLSNPLATDLFWSYFNSNASEDPHFFRRLLEAYPSQNRTIAERLSPAIGVDSGRIFIANGATEAIQAVLHNYSSHVHVNVPTFSPYYEFATPRHDVTMFQLDQEKDFILDPERYVRSVKSSGADTAILITPNNPDGYQIPDDHLEWILSRLSDLKTVVVDESFIHFARDAESHRLPTLVGLTEQYPNVTIVKSMSKDFGIAGVRAGYAIMKSSRVNELLDHGYLWNVNGLAEYFFSLFSRPVFLDEYRNVLNIYNGYISDFISKTSAAGFIQSFPTSANFQLIQITNGMTAELVTTLLLLRHGIYVRNCADKIGLDGEFIRVAIRTESENARIFQALEEVLA